MDLNARHRRTLEAIFRSPTSADIPFRDIERLLIALGAERTEGRGSRVRFKFDAGVIALHRPHPGKEAKMYVVEQLRRDLRIIGGEP